MPTVVKKYKQYEKYKASGIEWIGDIPEHWKLTKLKKYFSYEKGKNASIFTKEYIGFNEGQYPVYSGQTENDGIMGKVKTFDYDIEKCIFVTTVGAKVMTPKILSGKFSLSQNCLIMKPLGNMDCEYLFYILHPLFDYEKMLIPSYMQPSLRYSDLNSYSIIFCEEYKKIVRYLNEKTTHIDKIVDKKQKLVNILKEKRQTLISHFVTKGLDRNVKLKHSGIDWLGDIPEHWEIGKLKYLALLNPSKAEIQNLENHAEVTFLPMAYVSTTGFIDLESKKQYGVVKNDFTYFINNDVILAKITPCFENGKGALVDNLSNGVGFGSTEFHVLRPQKINPKFLYYLTYSSHFRKIGETVMTGAAGQKRIPEDFILNFKLGFPNLEEQIQIVKSLDEEMLKIDQTISKIEQQIEKIKEYRQTLISNAVTGKIDVREFI